MNDCYKVISLDGITIGKVDGKKPTIKMLKIVLRYNGILSNNLKMEYKKHIYACNNN